MPRAIFGIGLNYLAHAQEQNAELPERPIVFMKLPTSVAAPGAPVRAARGRRAPGLRGRARRRHGAGRRRRRLRGGRRPHARATCSAPSAQWTRAKGFDGACPFGPWITTADEVAEPGDLALRTWINGELRQDSRTSDLIFGVPEIVAFIRETITLEPGDLILTGTPSGVGMYFDPPRFLGSGDVVRIEIEGLGVIEHAVA